MNTAVINVKVEPGLKIEAQKLAAKLGFSLSSLVNGYLRQLVKTKTIHFSVKEEEPSEYLLKALRESEEERNKGEYNSFTNADQALDFIDKLINENRKN